MQFSILVSIVLPIALNASGFTSIPDLLNAIGEVEIVHGENTVLLVGDFPELKFCEGSGNAPGNDGTPGGEAACCIKLFHDDTNTGTALQGADCKSNNGRRKLSECPSGTFDIAHTCQDFGFWCHEDGSVVSGCVNCDLCDFPSTCPGCHNERRSLETVQNFGYYRLGEGHCVDSSNRRPPHCWGRTDEPFCRTLCTENIECIGFEYGQEQNMCQLVYARSPLGCPQYFQFGSGGDPSATEITQTYYPTGGSCWKKSTEATCIWFGCTCQGLSNFYGTHHNEHWGCAGDAAQHWWTVNACATSPDSSASYAGCQSNGGKMKITVDAANSLVLIGRFPKLKLCEGSGNHPQSGTQGGEIVCCIMLATRPKLKGQSCTETRGRRNLNGLCPDGSFDIERACRESAEWCHQTEGALDTCLGCNNCADPKTCPECTGKELKI